MERKEKPTFKTFIDLFCGLGGYHIALKERGLKCLFAADFDEDIRKLYKKNFDMEAQGDIKELNIFNIPKADIICASIPCQSFSINGKKKGFNDPRIDVFYNFIDIVEVKQPKILLMENVPHLANIENGEALQEIEQRISLAGEGYNIYKYFLNCSDYNMPQNRNRLYFVCIRKDLNYTSKKPEPEENKTCLNDIITEDKSKYLFQKSNYIYKEKKSKQSRSKLILVGHLYKSHQVGKQTQSTRVYSLDGHARTILKSAFQTPNSSGLYKTKEGVRSLSPLECKKVMGFAEEHHISARAKGVGQLGNAVVPKMIKLLFDNIYIND